MRFERSTVLELPIHIVRKPIASEAIFNAICWQRLVRPMRSQRLAAREMS